jgi:hypothetical protein
MKNLSAVEHTFQEATNMYESQEITKDEYLNLLQGLEVEKAVVLGEEEMRKKQQLQALIENTITVVSALS